MEYEQKLKQLEEEFQKVSKGKETLERQISFHKNWIIPKLKPGAELESKKKFLASLESDYSEISQKKESLERKLWAEQSKEFEFGWRKKETDEVLGRSSGGLSIHSSEMKALKIIAEKGGETNFGVISRRMRVNHDYARLLCMSLGRADYIDITPGGRCKITSKGEKELDKIMLF
ncbi:hypothetical protein MYX75_01580 [Acidobacteria bacterium AH-259-A15]|nr:hypothetical protein [Acidobacteria bacterium AH-259-A15]